MCGIAGIFNFNRQPVSAIQIKAMTDAIAHRGPDGEGYYLDSYLGLGHRRLSILDLSAAGQQPMQTKDGNYCISYNGEIYNFQAIRNELKSLGYHFFSKTDTEVVLKSYAEWGVNCLSRFNGMFAFAVWDKKKNQLFIARDRYGIKPFYYFINNKYFVFSSEIKAILSSLLCKPILDKEGLVEYLTFQNFFTDSTLFYSIKLLMPGYYGLVHLSKQFELKQYWDFNFNESIKIKEKEASEEIDRLFHLAIKRQLISDVPVNSYLSGGIDSGAITIVASKYLKSMCTFTIGFDLSSISGLELAFDERAKAEHISYLAKTEHYEMVLKSGDMERCMDKLVWHLEEPRVGQSYPNYYSAKLASKFGKVVLSGSGGDELFAGYPWRYFYSEKSKPFDIFIDEYYLKWQRLIPNAKLKKLLSPIWEDIKHVQTRDIFANVFRKNKYQKIIEAKEILNYSLYLEAKTFLHGLLLVEDKLSMAHSLETRVPFLDNDLVDFSMQLPIEMQLDLSLLNITFVNENSINEKRKIKFKQGKKLLRKTLSRYLPELITMSDKQGFSAPDSSWFRGESIDYIKKKLVHEKSRLNIKILQEIMDEHTLKKKNNRLAIWSFIYINQLLDSSLFLDNHENSVVWRNRFNLISC
ncbi:MAG: asparagine synthase (glutamine-hydrolyzing) [Rickettsia endosymbiont of Ixodes persulcatus]|nr:asparagine synthase (glutamine-hydrolyzing) [Rickettsia endosymbiont of Ixodes persulcatus]